MAKHSATLLGAAVWCAALAAGISHAGEVDAPAGGPRPNVERPGIEGLSAPAVPQRVRPGERPGAFVRCRDVPVVDARGRTVGTRHVCR